MASSLGQWLSKNIGEKGHETPYSGCLDAMSEIKVNMNLGLHVESLNVVPFSTHILITDLVCGRMNRLRLRVFHY